MNISKLEQLLTPPESATLEFKRKAYNLDHDDLDVRERQRGELIKDILSLANGSPLTVGDKAYLIIGADDKLQAGGNRNLFDVDPNSLTKQRILHLVNAACQPRLQDVECEPVEIEGKRLLVITIWPTPHLHETTRDLTTSQGKFTKHTVFIRHDENIEVASQREREAILKLKQIHLADTRKAPPVRFGAAVAAVTGGLIAAIPPDKETKPKTELTIGRMIGGTLLGVPFGSFMGWSFTGLLELRYEWYFLSNRKRITYSFAYVGAWILLWKLYRRIWEILISHTTKD